MKIQNIKALAYSTYLKINGYTILKNPKGASAAYVRAIRHEKGIDPHTLDKFESYTRVTKDFSKPNSKVTENLTRDDYAFYNKKSKEVKYKTKHLEYEKSQYNENPVQKSKGSISQYILNKRNMSEMHKPQYVRDEVSTQFSSIHLGFIPIDKVKIKLSKAELELEKYFEKIIAEGEDYTDSIKYFWKTLSHNSKL